MKKIFSFAVYVMAAMAMALAMESCKKESFEFSSNQTSVIEQSKTKDEEPSEKMVLGKELKNPYSVKNMQVAYESLRKQGYTSSIRQEFSINPTHLYVRFSISDTTDYSLLVDSAIELFTYPLDYEIIEEGLVYDDHNTSPPYYLYGVIPIQTQMPNVETEVLEECFIPNSNDVQDPALKEFLDRLEYESYLLTGNIHPDVSFDELTRARPSGTIRVHNNTPKINRCEGVKAVKIRVHNFVKIDIDYTDDEGRYQMNKNFIINNLHYAVIYENETGFKIWGNYAFLAPANYSLGWHGNTGYSKDIYTNSRAWLWSTVNNGTYIYRQTICPNKGVTKPVSDLRIWTFRMGGNWGGSAPMTKHVSIPSPTFSALLCLFGITNLLQYVNLVLPDIFVLQDYTSTSATYSCLFHELSHASHFSQVGGSYWRKYITAIVSNFGYGNGDGLYDGYIGVGEMWGNYFGYISEKEYFGSSNIEGIYDWYKPQILKDLHNNIPLTPLQIYNSLLPSINSHSKLKTKLKSNYGHTTQIDNIFSSYGF